MTDVTVEGVLSSYGIQPEDVEHHGVLGMKWGVHRERAARGNRRSQRVLKKADKQWLQEFNSGRGYVEINNHMADYMNGPNGEIAKHNAKFRNIDVSKPGPDQDRYEKEFAAVAVKTYVRSFKDLYGDSPSGKYHAEVYPNNGYVTIKKTGGDILFQGYDSTNVDLNHAATEDINTTVAVLLFDTNSKGQFTSMNSLDEVAHDSMRREMSDVTVEGILSSYGVQPEDVEHHGVLGMKWGKHLFGDRNVSNSDYSANQRVRDKQVYGSRGVSRINRALNTGQSIGTARSIEKTRRDTVLGRNKYVRQGGKVAGVVLGVAAANLAVSGLKKATQSRVGQTFMKKYLGSATSEFVGTSAQLLSSPQARAAISIGAAYVANMAAGDIAVGIHTRAAGYNPNRKK